MALEVAVVLVLNGAHVVRTPVFGSGDEGYHLSYAVHLAEGRGLPVVGQTTVHPQVLAVQDGVYPGPSRTQPADVGFRGLSYEAFQPPLYYALAAPFTTLTQDWVDKVRVLRALGVALLVVAVLLLGVLCRLVRPAAPLAPFSVALAAFLVPAFPQQEVLVSNDLLLVPLALAFTCLTWRALACGSSGALLAAALVAGLLLVTKLTSVWALPVLGLAALFLLVRATSWRTRLIVVVAPVVPLLVVLPWLLLNVERYGALTANALVLRLQAETSPPTHPTPGEELAHVRDVLTQLVLGRRNEYPDTVILLGTCAGLALLVLAAGVVLRREDRLPAVLLLAVPLLLSIAVLSVLSVVEGTQLLYERYLHPTAPLALLAAFLTLGELRRRAAARTRTGG